MSTTNAQVGIGTTDPKTTLQIEGDPATITTADGVRAPMLTLAELDAKISAYGSDQDGVIVYIDDVTTPSTETETAKITSKGYYYYDATNNVWNAMKTTTYSVGDFAQVGIVFWVDETGQHGLVAAKEDQDGGSVIQWYNGNDTDTEAHGDGVYAGEMNTLLIIANQGSNSNDYAAGVCANYTVTEGGVTYGDWYLPSKKELDLMYQNKATIDATAGANGGSGFASAYYWSSTEHASNNQLARRLDFGNGGWFASHKNTNHRVRAIRSF
ncbi:Lcl C-terminal domain-containing protein [Psychroflexus maritimus]|uniref:DUF1566 domain-containing protein n=1 Tax=Psychroflexus maritimus TaxID=2714865 RepID=A0A967ADR3_9FLAO|nr:DUF1566 domain-containing protein [Psychroflexus maritimus]NGZ90176.1 DUF1566 domain-containing protein [Psychroflexus maritimus]